MTKLIDSLVLPDDLKRLSIKELDQLCAEIRELLVGVVSKSGGHLAPSLGVVELTIALHAILDSPRDKIVWDVGHQAYVHKVLTGRKDLMPTIRTFGGISGFPKREESPHDAFGVGHASTSISAALGIAVARDIRGENFSVFTVIGDGSTSGGLAFEAIDNVANTVKGNFVVILNDNGRSISKPVGSLSQAITQIRTSSAYLNLKQKVEGMVGRIPNIGVPLTKKIEKLVDRTKNLITDYKTGVLFEELGFRYIGPIDGHNIPLLMSAITYARFSSKPVLIHVVTMKGKGYEYAENDPEKFHGISPFNVESGKLDYCATAPSYTEIFGQTILSLAQQHPEVCAITAAMPSGTGLSAFAKLYPERFFDVGIAEEHAVTFAAGLTTEGMKPFVAIYSTFMQRSYDQLIHDVCLQKLPVVFMLDRGGIVGEDGPTHHGLFDYAFMRHIPGLVVMAPKDPHELVRMMEYAYTCEYPVSIRYPRGEGASFPDRTSFQAIQLGRAELLWEHDHPGVIKMVLIGIGNMVAPALEAAGQLAEDYAVSVVNARFVKPLDDKLLLKVCREADICVTIEDGVTLGGFGSAVLECLSEHRLQRPLLRLGFPDQFVEHGTKQQLFEKYGLDVSGLLRSIRQFVNISKNT